MRTYEDLPLWDGKHIPLENEYILKVNQFNKGFATKLTKKNQIPVAFEKWSDSKIYLLTEYPRPGWSINGYRTGESRDWGSLRHPLGFYLEVYLGNLFSIIAIHKINCGKIDGDLTWEYGRVLTLDLWERKNNKTSV